MSSIFFGLIALVGGVASAQTAVTDLSVGHGVAAVAAILTGGTFVVVGIISLLPQKPGQG